MKGASASADVETLFNATQLTQSKAERELRTAQRESAAAIVDMTKKFQQDKTDQTARISSVMSDVM
jgi:hypothetical protein